MPLKSVLAKLSFLAAVFVVGAVLCPSIASQQSPPSLSGQQPQPWVGSISDPSQFAKTQSLADTLNDEAEAGDSAGIHRYSEHLIQLLLPDRAGQKYIRSLTDRMARAEELTRAGKGSLVPEAKVAQAYNDLMKEVRAPTSFLTDEAAVRNLRRLILFDKPGDALITASRNGTNCNPGEAVFLLLALFWNNGGPRMHQVSAPEAAKPSGTNSGRWVTFMKKSRSGASASRSLQSYSAAHRPRDIAALFDGVAKTMGF